MVTRAVDKSPSHLKHRFILTVGVGARGSSRMLQHPIAIHCETICQTVSLWIMEMPDRVGFIDVDLTKSVSKPRTSISHAGQPGWM